jgi:hypothetical protein
MVNFAKEVIPSDEEIRLVLEQASPNKAKEAITLLENIPQNRKAYVLRGLGWLLKLGILKIAS